MGPVGEHALRGNVGGSTDISDVQAHEKPEACGDIEHESIFVGVQVSGVYLSTGDTVINRKAYLWEFEYLVCNYLREQQWATNPKTPKKQTVRKKQELLFESIL